MDLIYDCIYYEEADKANDAHADTDAGYAFVNASKATDPLIGSTTSQNIAWTLVELKRLFRATINTYFRRMIEERPLQSKLTPFHTTLLRLDSVLAQIKEHTRLGLQNIFINDALLTHPQKDVDGDPTRAVHTQHRGYGPDSDFHAVAFGQA